MQLAPIRSAVHVPAAAIYAHFQGQDNTRHLAELDTVAEQTIDRPAVVDQSAEDRTGKLTTLE
ncbi:hypothetical protein [Cupriavidus necator]|uniref:hypothetical protein n=1 Tax=Cupriavidus necator TaxID=106590 RepID=UPI0005B3878D|nr:hypothetical protein [Cupriavidus necator]